MSKRTKRCPNCGAQMPQGAAICNKCGSKAEDSGWVDTLPKPVRPVETSRWPEKPSYEETAAQRETPNRSIGQLVAVLAVIVVIIVLAIVLVVKMNAPAASPAEESESYTPGDVIVIDPNGGGEPALPAAGEDEDPAEPTEEPEPTPEPSPEPTDMPESEEDPDAESEETEETEPEAEEEEFTVSEMDDTVYITGSSVNLRAGPGTDYDVVSTQTKGTELKRTGAVENGWSRVEYNGRVCYIYNDYVSTEKPPVEVSDKSDTVVITEDANLRTGPGTDHDVVTTLAKDTELKRTGVAENGWSRVEYDGKEAYIHSNLIEEKKEAESADNTDDSEEETEDFNVTEESGTVKVTIDIGANIRTGPGSDYDLLGAVAKDTELTVTGKTDDNWYQVKYNDKTGYVAGSLVTKN